jgi:iron complex outermembrane receptor protein
MSPNSVEIERVTKGKDFHEPRYAHTCTSDRRLAARDRRAAARRSARGCGGEGGSRQGGSRRRSEQDAQQSGEILVTARRREERVQEVPIAISVIGGEELGARGAFNVNRLQQQQPSLQFYSSNPRNSAINIRGLGAPFGLTNDGIEQGVGFYVDGVYIGRIGASTFDFRRCRARRGAARPAGYALRQEHHRRRAQHHHRAPSFTPNRGSS